MISFFQWMERRAYGHADVVTAHSDGNRVMLQSDDGLSGVRFETLRNWVDADEAADGRRDFRAEWGLCHRVLALFAGVIGPSQNLDVVLEAAKRLRDCANLTVLIVGDGTEKARLETRVQVEQIGNVVFKPFVSRADYPNLVAAADIGLVALSPLNHTPVVPGKLLSYMAGGRPIAAFLNHESDGHQIVRDARCGYTCVSDQPDEIEAILRRLFVDSFRRQTLGANGRAYVVEHFSKQRAVDRLETWLQPPMT